MLYIMYRIGYFLAMSLSTKSAYGVACAMADLWCLVSCADRKAVKYNLQKITGLKDQRQLNRMTRQVFRNFAKYLVDFFRFSKIDGNYIKRFVKVEGIDNLDEALSKGKGVVLLSAHIGNWELGALVVSSLRQPVMAVVLTHGDKRINDFFTRQRMAGKVKPIEIGISLRSCYEALKNNGLVALLGDRDFSGNGFYIDFFGSPALVPKGPAVFSARLDAEIVPTFMVREKDDTFRLIFEPRLKKISTFEEDGRVKGIMKEYISVIESYVKMYPTQWYMFKREWTQ
ncbi:MAG: lysophospholipid acyltransferase family protein [Candidatus Omnitrophica bacterium]|nr:lysophospholipid acyltransferase family protein [Candidatus Omnitrophota bacterium]